MSTNASAGSDPKWPSCISCYSDADAVIAVDGDGVYPYCGECSEYHVRAGHLEFPVEEFYHLSEGSWVSQTGDYHSITLFESDDNGSEHAWLEARSSAGYVNLTDYT